MRNREIVIQRLDMIDTIRQWENEAYSQTKIPVTDISHWDCSKAYQNQMLKTLKIPLDDHDFSYQYSYLLPDELNNTVTKKIGADPQHSHCVFVQSSTIAIINVANFVQKAGHDRVCILQPSYFTVEHVFQALGLEVKTLSLELDNAQFSIPLDDVKETNSTVVWITSPVFSTGVYYSLEEINKIKSLLDSGITVICDESLAEHGQEICRRLMNERNFFSIHSPHKTIAINAIKFSAILAHNTHRKFFDQWIDIMAGGLAQSNMRAIKHYVSDNYAECCEAFINYTQIAKDQVLELLSKQLLYYTISSNRGQYMTIFPKSPSMLPSLSLAQLEGLIKRTHVSLLPGFFSGFDDKYGGCFRINLTLERKLLVNCLNQVLRHLNSHCSQSPPT